MTAQGKPAPRGEDGVRSTHQVTSAEGPGSPGGLALPGRARALEGWDPGHVGAGPEGTAPPAGTVPARTAAGKGEAESTAGRAASSQAPGRPREPGGAEAPPGAEGPRKPPKAARASREREGP